MIRVQARIRLYKSGRTTPFRTDYRPLFNFIKEMKTSGQITFHDKIDFFPGDEGVVEITYLHREFLGEGFGVGTRFTFGEGREPFGDGVIEKLL